MSDDDVEADTDSPVQEERLLRPGNCDATIREYLDKVSTFEVPALPRDPISLFIELKRGRTKGGPYGEISLLETANRVMSDLIVLFAAKRLLTVPVPGLPSEQLKEIEIRLGVENGPDLQARLSDGRLVAGECFNVARSFFQSKRNRSLKNLTALDAGHHILAFNADAVARPVPYAKKSSAHTSFLLIDVADEIQQHRPPPAR